MLKKPYEPLKIPLSNLILLVGWYQFPSGDHHPYSMLDSRSRYSKQLSEGLVINGSVGYMGIINGSCEPFVII